MDSIVANIEPLTNADIAHHMFAFGCSKPASSSNSWNCGNVVCQGEKSILFAWGRNAPALLLPDGLYQFLLLFIISQTELKLIESFFLLKDVAFKVGPSTDINYIVVNIHYLKKVSNDRSGLAITVSDKP